ncbi:MAG: hypothetical protein ACI350_02525 [Prevotella sp.]
MKTNSSFFQIFLIVEKRQLLSGILMLDFAVLAFFNVVASSQILPHSVKQKCYFQKPAAKLHIFSIFRSMHARKVASAREKSRRADSRTPVPVLGATSRNTPHMCRGTASKDHARQASGNAFWPFHLPGWTKKRNFEAKVRNRVQKNLFILPRKR